MRGAIPPATKCLDVHSTFYFTHTLWLAWHHQVYIYNKWTQKACKTHKIRHIPSCCRVCPCFGTARGRRGGGWRRGWQGWSWDSTSVKTILVKNATTCRQDTASLLCSCVAVLRILFALFSYVTHFMTISMLTLKGTQSWTSMWANTIDWRKVLQKYF